MQISNALSPVNPGVARQWLPAAPAAASRHANPTITGPAPVRQQDRAPVVRTLEGELVDRRRSERRLSVDPTSSRFGARLFQGKTAPQPDPHSSGIPLGARHAVTAYLDLAARDDQGNPTHTQGIDVYV